MDSIIITPPSKKDLELLKEIAKKMGYKAKVVKGKKKQKKREIDEAAADAVTLMSEPALAEDWLSPEDDVYNNL